MDKAPKSNHPFNIIIPLSITSNSGAESTDARVDEQESQLHPTDDADVSTLAIDDEANCAEVAESTDSINEEFDATSVDDQRDDDIEDDEDDEGLKAQEEVDRQRMQKCFRRQEEAWLTKREKVSHILIVKRLVITIV